MKSVDLVIVGAGPAGLTAAIYASRYRVSNLVLGEQKGGTIGLAKAVENYPGFERVSGLELTEKFEQQAVKLGSEVVYDPADRAEKKGEGFEVMTNSGEKIEAKSLILATGTQRRKLNVPGETEFLGRGVSYCTTCDAPFFKEKTVVLVGGSDAAVSGAIQAAEYAAKVYIVYRGEVLRAEPIWVEKALGNPKIEAVYKTNLTAIKGERVVGAVELDQEFKGSRELVTDGVFIEIGGMPGTALAQTLGVELNEAGFVKVSREMATNLPGVFAAGDMTDFWPQFQQLVTAQAMGAVAAASAYGYLKKQTAPPQRG